ncbi:response regulator [Ectothiorhodospiraceae bacterium WFHF3C12]|nr:response regulator [Ectothiorhodospiraceae bacterium WFHF3C12]
MTRHALIVDDSKTACRTLALLLDKHGIGSTSVYSAEAALEELRHRKPDVIFMDQSMPGMDGLETVKIIKGNPDTATIPVMMYTAKEGDVYLGQARALGALDVLPKGQLKEKLDQVLEKLRFNAGEQAVDGPDTSLTAHNQLSPAAPAPPPRQSPPPDRDRDADLRRQLQSLSNELSRQLYMVLTEDQITQKEYARWLLDGVDRRIGERIGALEETLQAREAARAAEVRQMGRRRHRTVFAACIIIAGLCAAVLWQVSAIGRDGSALRASVADMTGQLSALSDAVTRTADAGTRGADPPSGDFRLGIVSESGRHVGVLVGMDNTGRYFTAVSRQDYVFHVNPTGRIGVPLHRTYFAAPNCNGPPMTHGQPGVIYRDLSGRLWYTPKDAAVENIRPASVMHEGERCDAVDSGEIALRPVRPNDPTVTGVSLDVGPVSLVQR